MAQEGLYRHLNQVQTRFDASLEELRLQPSEV
jgi:hypothetical protein